MSCHSSASFSFHVPRAFSRFFTTQLSLNMSPPCNYYALMLMIARIILRVRGDKINQYFSNIVNTPKTSAFQKKLKKALKQVKRKAG